MAESSTIGDSDSIDLRAQADETRRLLNGYINYLKRCKQGENEPGSHISIHEFQDAYELEDSNPNRVEELPPGRRILLTRCPINLLTH